MRLQRLVGGCLLLLWGCERAEPVFPIHRSVRFSLTLRNTSGELLRDSRVDVFAPIRELANQRTDAVAASLPYELVSDASGNQTLRLLVTIPPWASEVVNIRADVSLADSPNRVDIQNVDGYLAESRFVQVADAQIQSTAAVLTGNDDLEIARAAYQWVTENVSDPGFIREDRGALWALQNRAGDCTEQAFLFTALSRARGIPTRTVAGFVIRGDAIVRAGDYHNWAEFYADGSWRIADPQRKNFDSTDDRYVAMRIVDPSGDGPADAQRFAAFDPKLDVRID